MKNFPNMDELNLSSTEMDDQQYLLNSIASYGFSAFVEEEYVNFKEFVALLEVSSPKLQAEILDYIGERGIKKLAIIFNRNAASEAPEAMISDREENLQNIFSNAILHKKISPAIMQTVYEQPAPFRDFMFGE